MVTPGFGLVLGEEGLALGLVLIAQRLGVLRLLGLQVALLGLQVGLQRLESGAELRLGIPRLGALQGVADALGERVQVDFHAVGLDAAAEVHADAVAADGLGVFASAGRRRVRGPAGAGYLDRKPTPYRHTTQPPANSTVSSSILFSEMTNHWPGEVPGTFLSILPNARHMSTARV